MVDREEGKGTEGDDGAWSDLAGTPTETSPIGYVSPAPPRSVIRDAETPLERPRDSEGNRRDVTSSGRLQAARNLEIGDTEPPSDDENTKDEQPLPVHADVNGSKPRAPQDAKTGHGSKTEHTMRSVDTPTPMSRQPWDERRIGNLELEVEHLAAGVKLLEKSLERARLEARVRSLMLLVVLLIALLARVL